MWGALADATGDYADCCPETGEVWQYMGTYDGVHQFRHRHRPESCPPIKGYAGKHAGRVYLHIHTVTLRVTRVNVSGSLSTSYEQRHIPREDYSGAFDGFHVTSDADPGL